jgi:hypothetical protein
MGWNQEPAGKMRVKIKFRKMLLPKRVRDNLKLLSQALVSSFPEKRKNIYIHIYERTTPLADHKHFPTSWSCSKALKG